MAESLRKIPESELLLQPDGSIFHLRLKPEQLADTIILVGDPGRVAIISSFFDEMECQAGNREYVSATGYYKGKRLTVQSTGIGVGNVDIVMNELDALANIDFNTRLVSEHPKSLNFIRIGTSGSLQEKVKVNDYVISKMAVGMDNLLHYYKGLPEVVNVEFGHKIKETLGHNFEGIDPYVLETAPELLKAIGGKGIHEGITMTAPGFYVPQGRELRLQSSFGDINERLTDFKHKGVQITNYEMEGAGIYGLAKLLGHQAITICLIIANRKTHDTNREYRPQMEGLIKHVLDRVSSLA